MREAKKKPGRPQKPERGIDPLRQIAVTHSVKQRLIAMKRSLNEGKRLKMTLGDVIVSLLEGALGAQMEKNNGTPRNH